MKLIIAMPAYNEEKSIGSVILAARQYTDSVIVIDDGSWDKTVEVAYMAGADVFRNQKNYGYGYSIRRIFHIARNEHTDMLITIDADGQHDTGEIPKFIEAIDKGFDIVIGSRTIDKHNIPFYRMIGQKIICRVTNFASHQKLSDTESGFRAYSNRAINNLVLKERGMGVSAEIIVEASAKYLHICEVPIKAIYSKKVG